MVLAAAALAGLVSGCARGSATPAAAASAAARAHTPRLRAEVVQLRRDEALGRVEVAVTNRSGSTVTIETIDLRVPGFSGGGRQVKGEPLPAGQRVNLPTPYGEVSCDDAGAAHVGAGTVEVLVHSATDPTSHREVLPAQDPDGLMPRIAAQTCLVRRLDAEVPLAFGPTWRRTGRGAEVALHGTLVARLGTDQPRDVTQVAGTVIFDLAPDGAARSAHPLARLTSGHPRVAIPIVLRTARCTGHAIGETKKPYAFLVWLAAPGGPEQAVTLPVSAADKAALQALCRL